MVEVIFFPWGLFSLLFLLCFHSWMEADFIVFFFYRIRSLSSLQVRVSSHSNNLCHFLVSKNEQNELPAKRTWFKIQILCSYSRHTERSQAKPMQAAFWIQNYVIINIFEVKKKNEIENVKCAIEYHSSQRYIRIVLVVLVCLWDKRPATRNIKPTMWTYCLSVCKHLLVFQSSLLLYVVSVERRFLILFWKIRTWFSIEYFNCIIKTTTILRGLIFLLFSSEQNSLSISEFLIVFGWMWLLCITICLLC